MSSFLYRPSFVAAAILAAVEGVRLAARKEHRGFQWLIKYWNDLWDIGFFPPGRMPRLYGRRDARATAMIE